MKTVLLLFVSVSRILYIALDSRFYDLGLKPTALETYAKGEIIMPIKKVFDEVRPELIFLPFAHDAHSDHRMVYECAIACTKAFRAPYVRKVLCMDIISETDYGDAPFPANSFVDIGAYIKNKIEISKIYQSEILSSPFPRVRRRFGPRRDTGGGMLRRVCGSIPDN